MAGTAGRASVGATTKIYPCRRYIVQGNAHKRVRPRGNVSFYERCITRGERPLEWSGECSVRGVLIYHTNLSNRNIDLQTSRIKAKATNSITIWPSSPP